MMRTSKQKGNATKLLISMLDIQHRAYYEERLDILKQLLPLEEAESLAFRETTAAIIKHKGTR